MFLIQCDVIGCETTVAHSPSSYEPPEGWALVSTPLTDTERVKMQQTMDRSQVGALGGGPILRMPRRSMVTPPFSYVCSKHQMPALRERNISDDAVMGLFA